MPGLTPSDPREFSSGKLELDIHDVEKILQSLRKLEQSGIVTDNVIVGQHRVHLRWNDDQRDGAYWTITGIETYP